MWNNISQSAGWLDELDSFDDEKEREKCLKRKSKWNFTFAWNQIKSNESLKKSFKNKIERERRARVLVQNIN